MKQKEGMPINNNSLIIIALMAIMSFAFESFGQQIDYNQQDGFIANGYDVVSYFNGKPEKGKDEFTYKYDGATFKFSSNSNLITFKNNPSKYIPQYGGWCAYAMGSKGEKVSIDPLTFEINEGKLYLFYNAYFNNTLKSWRKEGADNLRIKADKNWEKIKFKE